MRKIVISAVAALGFLVIGLTVFGQTSTVAMVDTNHSSRPLLVATNLFPVTDAGTG